jgi:hypothetical protein
MWGFSRRLQRRESPVFCRTTRTPGIFREKRKQQWSVRSCSAKKVHPSCGAYVGMSQRGARTSAHFHRTPEC